MVEAAVADTYWRSLRYFNVYRLTVSGLLIGLLTLPSLTYGLFEPIDRGLFLSACAMSVALSILSLLVLTGARRNFNLQLTFQVMSDIAVYVVLMQASGGLRGGIGMLLLVSLAAAGLVGQGRLVLFYAAIASIAVLFQHVLLALRPVEFDLSAMFQAGLLCTGFFATASSARLLARRVVANEELARKRGLDLQRQIRVSDRAIAQLDDGVLVVDGEGELIQANPRARDFLGLTGDAAVTSDGPLSLRAPELARELGRWQRGEAADEFEFRTPLADRHLRARFVELGPDSRDTLVFVEDIGKQQALAQQVKLAALGRLTANIAHEIRNPLSAIQHSAELLLEAKRDPSEERLLRILIDNTHRLERMVSDVLQIGRRDRTHREVLDLRKLLPPFIEEFCSRANLPPDVVECRIDGSARLTFDRSHLHHVLSNLFENALRHGRRQSGSLRLWVADEAGRARIHVADDGDGIAPDLRAQVFEPFFTTHAKGTGLGLYIAREFCDANGARLELMENAPGAHFCVIGG